MKSSNTTPWRIGLIATAGLWLGAAPRSDAEESLNAEAISIAVDDELTADHAVPGWKIDVSTAEGIVTLAGSVNNILAKERAERIASTVKGVRAVVNEIEIDAPYRADNEIAEDVQDALVWDPATESWEIESSVSDGTVTLSGTVDSWPERELAAKIAKGIRGVSAIENRIKVDYKEDRADAAIQADVEGALRWDAYIDHVLIDVAVNDGKVLLTGTVGSLAEKDRARDRALVAGVESVDNSGLEVKWWARDGRMRKGKYDAMSDTEIHDAIQDAFWHHPRVHAYKLDVETDGGYVTLRGTVDNARAKRAAGDAARGVVGVFAVDNKIKVRPGTPTDSRIESNVKAALVRDPYVDRYEIDVSVLEGSVYLYGEVDSTYEKARADDVAARQVGVRDVNNFLTIQDPRITTYDPYVDDWYWYDYDWYTLDEGATAKSDWEIEEDIKDELFWSPFVDSDDINVDVEDGVALLTGTVETWSERQTAAENALEGGAVSVDNDLMVEYGPEYYNP